MKKYLEKCTVLFTEVIGNRFKADNPVHKAVIHSEIGKSGIEIDKYKDEVFGKSAKYWCITNFIKEIVKQ